jgi:transglutaminase-like putative cysteine protease
MRGRLMLVWFVAFAAGAVASPVPPYEVVRDHVEVEVASDGSYVADREEVYRIVDQAGIKLMQERRLYFTPNYESLEIAQAYSLKPDGRRIDVPTANIVTAFVPPSTRAYYDRKIVRLFYPDLAAQDRIVLVTKFRQKIPWFPGQFDMRAIFSRTIVAHDVVYRVDAPAGLALHIDAPGLAGGPVQADTAGQHWVWQFSNDAPVFQAMDAVGEADFAPHLQISTFSGYDAVAKAYRDRARNAGAVTKDIAALAGVLTRDVTDRREQARILYEWVCTNVAYVAIELGIGGFSPHSAEDVLQNRIGDCKDRAVLLEALLAAKGIESTAVLINAGSGTYRLPAVASPHAFDHVITYLPALDLFVDASDALAPFGVLPYADSGKPVLLASTGRTMQTPVQSAAHSRVRVASTVAIKEDGTVEGRSEVEASGAYGIYLRALIQSAAEARDANILRLLIGPGTEGKIERGEPQSLHDPFVVAAEYRLAGAVSLPGPGALPLTLSLKPFSFSDMVTGRLPQQRTSAYVCPSVTAEETIRLSLPPNIEAISLPASGGVGAAEIGLSIDVAQPAAQTIALKTTLTIDHPQAVCTPAYYQGVRDDLRKMDGLLRRQIVYRERTPGKT